MIAIEKELDNRWRTRAKRYHMGKTRYEGLYHYSYTLGRLVA
jgi:hypothetical protein